MRLLLIGCTGFVGAELIPELLTAGHQLTVISRKAPIKFPTAYEEGQLIQLRLNPADPSNWKQAKVIAALEQAEGVVNLAGEPIAERRWTQKQCTLIENSRLNTTRSLVQAMTQLKRPPRVLVNASAIGYYGASADDLFTEESKCGDDFLSNLCEQWENIARQKPRSTRLIIIRLGIVLGPDGGALKKMLPIFKAGLGGPIGNGKQWMSWIHRKDLCKLIAKAISNQSWSGVINGVAPEAVPMKEFAKALGKVLGRPSLLPVPGAILKLLLGDGASVVLEGQQVSSKRLEKLGFKFQYPEISQALAAATK